MLLLLHPVGASAQTVHFVLSAYSGSVYCAKSCKVLKGLKLDIACLRLGERSLKLEFFKERSYILFQQTRR